ERGEPLGLGRHARGGRAGDPHLALVGQRRAVDQVREQLRGDDVEAGHHDPLGGRHAQVAQAERPQAPIVLHDPFAVEEGAAGIRRSQARDPVRRSFVRPFLVRMRYSRISSSRWSRSSSANSRKMRLPSESSNFSPYRLKKRCEPRSHLMPIINASRSLDTFSSSSTPAENSPLAAPLKNRNGGWLSSAGSCLTSSW